MTPLDLQRIFRAPLEDVYRAWVEPERLRRWFRPLGDFEAERVSLDPRPGGSVALEFAGGPAGRIGLAGRFEELAPGRIVLALARRDPSGAVQPSTRITATLAEEARETRLCVHHEGVPEGERALVAAGWMHCLGRLAGALELGLEHYYGRLQRFPRFRSAFGGLWPDLSDVEARIEGKRALGLLTAEDARLFEHWSRNGYVVLRGAVDTTLVDRLVAEMDAAWQRGDPAVAVEVFEAGQRSFRRLDPSLRDRPHKLLDYHGVSATARAVQFAPAIRRFLGQLFERPPLAFQSLAFRWGTEQDMHQDTAFVALRSPMEMVGCWIALEDITEGSGELQYYVGSHRIPEYVWFGRGRAKPEGYEDDRDFLRHVRVESEALGCPLERFLPRKGDVLLWHADLVHGGSKRVHPQVTRQSLVTHFCPVDVDPEWMGEHASSPKLEHEPGCYYCFMKH